MVISILMSFYGKTYFTEEMQKKCQFSVKSLFIHMECMYHITFKVC